MQSINNINNVTTKPLQQNALLNAFSSLNSAAGRDSQRTEVVEEDLTKYFDADHLKALNAKMKVGLKAQIMTFLKEKFADQVQNDQENE